MSAMEPDQGAQPGDEVLDDDGAEVPPEELQAEAEDDQDAKRFGSGADQPDDQ